jgi:hypothetical protein
VRSIVSCITYALFCPANSSHILYARHNSTPQALDGTNTTLAVKMKLLLLCCWLCQIVNLLAAFNLRVLGTGSKGIGHGPGRARVRPRLHHLSLRMGLNSALSAPPTTTVPIIGSAAHSYSPFEADCDNNSNSDVHKFCDTESATKLGFLGEANTPTETTAPTTVDDNNNNCKQADIDMLPLTTTEQFRAHYGCAKSVWGDWSPHATRKFYKQHLPRCLLTDGAFNLTLEERARIAAASRNALRAYTRERCR